MTTVGGAKIEPSRHGDEQFLQVDIDDKGKYSLCLNIKGFVWKKGYAIDRECAIYFDFKDEDVDRLVDGLIRARDELRKKGGSSPPTPKPPKGPDKPPEVTIERKRPKKTEEGDVLEVVVS